MTESKCEHQSPEALLGASIVSASSSLHMFSCEFNNGKGLLVEAIDDDGEPGVRVTVVDSEQLPHEQDAVCHVDWKWIYGSQIAHLASTSGALKLKLSEAGPLTISAQTWQGKPFLAFQPYKSA